MLMRRMNWRCIACPKDVHRVKTSPPPCLLPPTALKPSIDISYSYNPPLNISSIPTCQRTCPPLANPTCQVRWRNAHGLPFNIPTCQKPVCNLILASGSSCGFACQDPLFSTWATKLPQYKAPYKVPPQFRSASQELRWQT